MLRKNKKVMGPAIALIIIAFFIALGIGTICNKESDSKTMSNINTNTYFVNGEKSYSVQVCTEQNGHSKSYWGFMLIKDYQQWRSNALDQIVVYDISHQYHINVSEIQHITIFN